MASDPVSPELPPNSQEQTPNQVDQAKHTPKTAQNTVAELPSGKCMFITLHQATTEQRCSCQGFRRNEVLPGAYCDCGHQACYHAHHVTPPPLPPILHGAEASTTQDPACNSLSHSSLLDRIHNLESTHALDRKQWERALRQERHARQEDIRTLREAMYTFFRVIEKDMPRQFTTFEDRIEALVDSHQRLQEKIINVDDFSMALDDRLIELEQSGPQKKPGRNECPRKPRYGDDEHEASLVRTSGEGGYERKNQFPEHTERNFTTGDSPLLSHIKMELPVWKNLHHIHASDAQAASDTPSDYPLTEETDAFKHEGHGYNGNSTSMKRKRNIKVERDSNLYIKLSLPNPPPLLLSE